MTKIAANDCPRVIIERVQKALTYNTLVGNNNPKHISVRMSNETYEVNSKRCGDTVLLYFRSASAKFGFNHTLKELANEIKLDTPSSSKPKCIEYSLQD